MSDFSDIAKCPYCKRWYCPNDGECDCWESEQAWLEQMAVDEECENDEEVTEYDCSS